MNSKEELVEHLKKDTQTLKTKAIESAFLAIDRADFINSDYKIEAYEDCPIPISYGQTISQPTTVAFMFELLGPKKDENILDVGSGSGWTTALLAHIAGPRGSVVGVEIVPELAAFGRKNLKKYHFSHAKIIDAVKEYGYREQAPYDRILVSAAGSDVPQALVDQLKSGGTMVIPVQDSVYKITKDAIGNIAKEKHYGFAFVPLIKK